MILPALRLAPTPFSALINARTPHVNTNKGDTCERGRVLGGVERQNDPMFHVEMTEIEFLMILLLNMANVWLLLGPCDKMREHKAITYNLCAAGARRERTKLHPGSTPTACCSKLIMYDFYFLCFLRVH